MKSYFVYIILFFFSSISSAQTVSISAQLPNEVAEFVNQLCLFSVNENRTTLSHKLSLELNENILSDQTLLAIERKSDLLGFIYTAKEQIQIDRDGLEYWGLMAQLNEGKNNAWLSSGLVHYEGLDIYFVNLIRKHSNQSVPYIYYLYKKGSLLFEIIYKNPSSALIN